MFKRIICYGLLFALSITTMFIFLPKRTNWNKYFYLPGEKVIWDETSFPEEYYEYTLDDDELTYFGISFLFQPAKKHINITLKDLNITNVHSYSFTSLYTCRSGYDYYEDEFSIVMYGSFQLFEGGKENVIKAIRHLESLPFIRNVVPEAYRWE